MRAKKEKREPATPRKRWSVPLNHPTFVIEECPGCGYPEADGGYCPECGLTRHGPGCPCHTK